MLKPGLGLRPVCWRRWRFHQSVHQEDSERQRRQRLDQGGWRRDCARGHLCLLGLLGLILSRLRFASLCAALALTFALAFATKLLNSVEKIHHWAI